MKLITLPIVNSRLYILPFFVLFFLSCSSTSQTEEVLDDETGEVTPEEDTDKEEVTEPETTDYDITPILALFDNIEAVSYSVSNGKVTFNTTNLPNHKSPYYQDTEWHNDLYADYSGTNNQFRLNPNRIGQQNISITVSLSPQEASNKEETPMGAIGISRNGIVFFNQYAAGRSALDGEINSFDQYLGHPTGTEVYHYHIEPTYLTEEFGDEAFLGLLTDGFPVYGPVENGEILTSDDLDDYHGHYGVTTEFPNGIYHYHVTATAPYINGDGFYGTPGTVSN